MTSTPPRAQGRFNVLALLLGLVVVAGFVGYLFGNRSAATILTGRADSGGGGISIITPDWTYGVPVDGVMWTDRSNSLHEGGRPDCLAPDVPAFQVRFAAVQVTVDDNTWRPVVWIDCRSAP
ncbi:MAG TPA: hypothetical protein VFY18_05190 [Candidatus Limnocylindrales bacterium]|nr:hypothetical protein [Candidatus Limnocylindrales bacterium]